jgi:hypothetical protein
MPADGATPAELAALATRINRSGRAAANLIAVAEERGLIRYRDGLWRRAVL